MRSSTHRDDGSLPLLGLPKRKDDIAQLRRVLKTFRAAPRQKFRDVIILGTGGSSLGGQTLYALADERAQPRLHFLDNIDPATFELLFAAIDPARTGVVAISKSGGTAETMTQFAICIEWLRAKLDPDAVGRHTIAVTEPRDNPLRLLATRLKHADPRSRPGHRRALFGALECRAAAGDARGSRCRGAARRRGRVLDATLGASDAARRRAGARRRDLRRPFASSTASTRR